MKTKNLYYALIGTFTLLYLAVAFVSTLHAITFFQLANSLGMAILLGAAYEVGQATVLFSILLTEHKNRTLPWIMMFLLTGVQITSNVFASYKFMIESGTSDWQLWQQSILFGVQAESPEMYQMIISWIIGALLPIIALGMTALVADNLHLIRSDDKKEIGSNIDTEKLNQMDKLIDDELSEALESKFEKQPSKKELEEKYTKLGNEIKEKLDFRNNIQENEESITTKEPVNKSRGWHLKSHYVDNEGNVFRKGKFQYQSKDEIPKQKLSKKEILKTKVKSKILEKKKSTNTSENDKIKKNNKEKVDNVSVIDVKK